MEKKEGEEEIKSYTRSLSGFEPLIFKKIRDMNPRVKDSLRNLPGVIKTIN